MVPDSGRFNRAAFLSATAGLVAAPAFARAQSLTKLRIAAGADGDCVAALWGASSGIFAKYGLDVDVMRLNSGSAVAAAVAGGSIDIGKSSAFNMITAHAKGIPFVIEAPCTFYLASASDFAILVAKDSKARDGRDLAGKIVAVPALGDYSTITTLAWIDKNGGDSKTVKFLEIPPSAMGDSVAAGRVDAAVIAEPLLSQFVSSGKCRVFGRPIDALGKRMIVTVYFCTADFAQKNADVLARFRKGLDEAAAYALAHRTQMIPVVAKYTALDPAMVALQQAPNLANAASLRDVSLIQPTIDAAATYKAIPKSFPVKELIDPVVFAG
jgi:NitT/TauT family transport system substrate-binding protein